MAWIRTSQSGLVTQDELHAYADDRLSEDRIAAVEAHLRDHPNDALRVADWRHINNALRVQADAALAEPMPAAIVGILERRSGVNWRAIAASIVWLGLGIGVGGVGQRLVLRPDATMRIAEETRGAYAVFGPEDLHPVELGADRAQHLSDWLGKRLGRPVPIPSLNDLGFSFVGGRLMVTDGTPAAMLMYENGSGRRMVLYVAGSTDPDDNNPMEYKRLAESGVITWIRDGRAYGVAGGFNEAELMPAAQSIRAQFSA